MLRESGGNKKWPLLLRFLDPALSVSSLPLPGIERQPEGATGHRSFPPMTPAGDWFRPVGSGLLVRRTNLLSPSVALLPVFKVTLTTATDVHFLKISAFLSTRFFQIIFSTTYLHLLMEMRCPCGNREFPTLETVSTKSEKSGISLLRR